MFYAKHRRGRSGQTNWEEMISTDCRSIMWPAALFQMLSPTWSRLMPTMTWQRRALCTRVRGEAIGSERSDCLPKATQQRRGKAGIPVCLTLQPVWCPSPVPWPCPGLSAQHTWPEVSTSPGPCQHPVKLSHPTPFRYSEPRSVLALRTDSRLLLGTKGVQAREGIRGGDRSLGSAGLREGLGGGPGRLRPPGHWEVEPCRGSFLRSPGCSLRTDTPLHRPSQGQASST